MSYLTETDVNKRANNLFVAFEVAAGNPGVTLVSEQADMTFFAVYAADVPGVVAITGVWDAAQSGVNVTLSAGDTVADISSTGASIGTINNTTDPVACEFVIGTNLNLSVGYYIAGLAPPYDPDAYAGGSGFFSSYYEPDGTIVSFAGGSAGNPPLAAGDIVGIAGSSGSLNFYINGVLISTVGGSNNNLRPMVTRP